MVRIKIDWEIVSPFLRFISGILIIEDIDSNSHSIELLRCKVTKKLGKQVIEVWKNMDIQTKYLKNMKI